MEIPEHKRYLFFKMVSRKNLISGAKAEKR